MAAPLLRRGYSTFLMAREAVSLIEAHDDREPFFLYLPFNAVHGPHQAPQEYLERYSHIGRAGAQRAQLECMDMAVGQVLAALERAGILDSTLVMFTNDNGGTRITSNGPYRGFKSHYHEGGVRVPARAPMARAHSRRLGQRRDAPCGGPIPDLRESGWSANRRRTPLGRDGRLAHHRQRCPKPTE